MRVLVLHEGFGPVDDNPASQDLAYSLEILKGVLAVGIRCVEIRRSVRCGEAEVQVGNSG
jgi:hypothetical protein